MLGIFLGELPLSAPAITNTEGQRIRPAWSDFVDFRSALHSEVAASLIDNKRNWSIEVPHFFNIKWDYSFFFFFCNIVFKVWRFALFGLGCCLDTFSALQVTYSYCFLQMRIFNWHWGYSIGILQVFCKWVCGNILIFWCWKHWRIGNVKIFLSELSVSKACAGFLSSSVWKIK